MKQNTYFHVRFKWQNHISVMFKIYNCEKTLSFFLQKERKMQKPVMFFFESITSEF